MSELYNKSLQFLPQKLFSHPFSALIILFNLNDEVENREKAIYDAQRSKIKSKNNLPTSLQKKSNFIAHSNLDHFKPVPTTVRRTIKPRRCNGPRRGFHGD